MKQLKELTGLYSLSKTLRFELKPIGNTLRHIEAKGLITQDEQRAEEYKKVKDIRVTCKSVWQTKHNKTPNIPF